jgi:TolB-like protein/Tfp pilus assembly protein PilF
VRGEKKSLPAIRFGVFEADIEAGELRRSGVKVRLQEQPFQVLAALLERPGQVITRAELQKKIWIADTFVNFDCGLNKAVNRLRHALGDSADTPKFIETLPRRGYRFAAPVEQGISSLAVLPLDNLSGDPKQEYWADGMTDELITHLAKIRDLRVISRTSAMRFKNTTLPLGEIARQLGVGALIRGSVVVSDRKVRIRAQLINPFTDDHLWVDSYERELGDVMTLQRQIAYAIACQIRSRLTPEEEAGFAGVRSVNAEAYEAYLKGRFFWNKRTKADLERSFAYFRQAIAADAAYAAPYAGLADCYILMNVFGLSSPHVVCPKAREAAEKALELDEGLPEAHNSLAAVRHLYYWDWPGSEQEFRRALELDRNCAVAHHWYAVLLSLLQRHEEAIAQVLAARDLDPLSLVVNAFVGFIYMKAGRHDRAIEACRQAIELDPNNPFGHWLLARGLDAGGKLDEALGQSHEAAKQSGNSLPYVSHLGYAYARVGDRLAACNVLEQLTERSMTEYVSPFDFALIYSALDEKELAIEWLKKAFQERNSRLVAEFRGPVFGGLQFDTTFQDLTRRFGLPSSETGQS